MTISHVQLPTTLRTSELRVVVTIFLVIGSLLLALYAASGYALLANVADDAFFFYRYALNFANGNGFSWVPSGPAEYGGTSQLFQIVITLLHAVNRSANELILPFASMAFGFLASAGMIIIIFISAPKEAGPAWRLVIALALGGIQAKLSDHYLTGMETALSVLMVCIFVLVLLVSVDRNRFAICCLFVPLIYLTRPEAALIPGFTALTILAAMDRHRWFEIKTLRWLSIAAGLLVGQWILFWLVYRTPVPIPLFLKSFNSVYSSEAVQQYGFGNMNEFYQLVRSCAIPLMLSIVALAILLSASWRHNAWQIGLAVGAAAFVLYGVFGNRVPITSGGARFLVPALPVVALLSGLAAWRLWTSAERLHGPPLGRTILLAALACNAVIQLPPMIGAMANALIFPAIQCKFQCWSSASRTEALVKNIKHQAKWDALLPYVEQIPRNCSIADTEVGAVGALDWKRPWLDYSGLNYLDLVKRRNVVEQLLKDQPDFAFLGRITWYWGVTAEELATLKEAFEPLDGPVRGADTLYVRKQSNCVRYVPVHQL
jgi:hypothetical protein